jgi:exodeoxyribonuclease VII large subunit
MVTRINSQRERLQEKKNRLKTDTKRYLAEVKKEYSALASRFKLGRFLQRIESERSALKKSKMQLQRSYESSLNLLKQNLIHLKNRLKIEPILKRLDNERKSLRTKEQIIQALNPENNLKRGYSLVYNEDGTLVKSVKNVKKGTVVKTKTSDGKFESTIDSIES